MFNYKPLSSLQSENSYLYLLRFPTQIQANDRVYFTMDSQIDNSTVVGIETHAFIFDPFIFATWDFPQTIDIDGIAYNVISPTELGNMTLTLVNKQRQQVLSQYPFKALFNKLAYTFPSTRQSSAKGLNKYKLDILSGECYVTFTVGSAIPAPFVAPITFYFDPK